FCFSLPPAPPCPPLFPYTTLFRSVAGAGQGAFPRSASSGSADFVKVHRAHQLSFGYMAVAIDENGGRVYPTGFGFNNQFSAGPKDRKSTRLNSSHRTISYAVFCLK